MPGTVVDPETEFLARKLLYIPDNACYTRVSASALASHAHSALDDPHGKWQLAENHVFGGFDTHPAGLVGKERSHTP